MSIFITSSIKRKIYLLTNINYINYGLFFLPKSIGQGPTSKIGHTPCFLGVYTVEGVLPAQPCTACLHAPILRLAFRVPRAPCPCAPPPNPPPFICHPACPALHLQPHADRLHGVVHAGQGMHDTQTWGVQRWCTRTRHAWHRQGTVHAGELCRVVLTASLVRVSPLGVLASPLMRAFAHAWRQGKGGPFPFPGDPVCAAPPQANRGGPATLLGYKGRGMPTPGLLFAARVPSPAFVAPPIVRPHPPEGLCRAGGTCHRPQSRVPLPQMGSCRGGLPHGRQCRSPSAPSPPPFMCNRGA
jgi:hypothetical protein